MALMIHPIVAISSTTVLNVQFLAGIFTIFVACRAIYLGEKITIQKLIHAFLVRGLLLIIYFPAIFWCIYTEEKFSFKAYNIAWWHSFTTLE